MAPWISHAYQAELQRLGAISSPSIPTPMGKSVTCLGPAQLGWS